MRIDNKTTTSQATVSTWTTQPWLQSMMRTSPTCRKGILKSRLFRVVSIISAARLLELPTMLTTRDTCIISVLTQGPLKVVLTTITCSNNIIWYLLVSPANSKAAFYSRRNPLITVPHSLYPRGMRNWRRVRIFFVRPLLVPIKATRLVMPQSTLTIIAHHPSLVSISISSSKKALFLLERGIWSWKIIN